MDTQRSISPRVQSPFPVHKLLLSKDSIAKIQNRLGEYRKSIMYLLNFIGKAQQILDHHMAGVSLCLRASSSSSGSSSNNTSNNVYSHSDVKNNNSNISQSTISPADKQLLHQRLSKILTSAASTFNSWNPLFPLNSRSFEMDVLREIEEIFSPQSSLALTSIASYKEFEIEFFKELQKYKDQCRQTQIRVDNYTQDVSVLYNPKEQQTHWDKLEKEYTRLLDRQSAYEDYLDLIQTKKKALGINLEELMEGNQKNLGTAIRIIHSLLQRATPSFPLFFAFLSTRIEEASARIPKLSAHNGDEYNTTIIPNSDMFSSKSLPKNHQMRKFPNFLYWETQWTDRHLAEFYQLTVTYIYAIENESIEKQQQVRSSMKALELLRVQQERCAKGLWECLAAFSEKEKVNVRILLGSDENQLLANLFSSIEVTAASIEKQAQIVQAVRDQVGHHLSNLQACHKQVFTALHKSLVDHHSLRSEFSRVLDFTSQYTYAATQGSSDQLLASHHESQPNFMSIKRKIVQAIPLLQECVISLLNDFEKSSIKEIKGVRDSLDKVIQSMVSTCKEVVARKVQEERFQPKKSQASMVSESAVAQVTARILREDEAFRLFYSDLKDEIDRLHFDFVKEEHFDYNQISRLKPPHNCAALKQRQVHVRPSLNSNRAQYVADDNYTAVSGNDVGNESFLSFNHGNQEEGEEEEKHNNFPITIDDESSLQQYFESWPPGDSPQRFVKGMSNSAVAATVDESVTQGDVSNMSSSNPSSREELASYEAFLKKRTRWSENEELKHHFSCAFSQNISLQGRMYVTNKRLIFQSYFNGNNLFFNETLLEIPRADILKIHKKKNMLLFDNAIQIDVAKGSLLFTQFIYRDDAYASILKVLRPAEMVGADQQSSRVASLSASMLRTPEKEKDRGERMESPQKTKGVSQSLIHQRNTNIQQIMKKNDGLKFALYETQLKGEGVRIRDLFESCYSDTKYTHDLAATGGKEEHFDNYFFYYILKVMKCWNLQMTPWTPQPPSYFMNSSEEEPASVESWVEMSEREASYEKTIPFSGIPFLPKSCLVQEKQRLFFINPNEVVFEIEAFSSGAPLADTFYVVIRSYFKQESPNAINYKTYLDIKWVKSCWVSGTIESQSNKEGIRSSIEIAKYFQERLTHYLATKKTVTPSSTAPLSTVQPALSTRSSQDRKALQQREMRINKAIGSLEKYTYDIYSLTFSHPSHKVTASEIFRLLFSDDQPYKSHADLFEYLKVSVFSDKNYNATRFDPPVPEMYASSSATPNASAAHQILPSDPDSSTRVLTYVHPLPPSKIPFMPKTCQVKEVIKVFWVSSEKIIIFIEAFTTGIPKGDTFSVRVVYNLSQLPDGHSVQLTVKSYVHFNESSFLQSTIESNTIEQQQIQSETTRKIYVDVFEGYIATKRSIERHNSLKSSKTRQLDRKNSQKVHDYAKLIDERAKRILSGLESSEAYKQVLFVEKFTTTGDVRVSAFAFAQLLFGEKHVHKGYRDFTEHMKVSLLSETGFTCQEFVPAMPERNVEMTAENWLKLPDYCEREMNYIHPVPENNIPFMPKTCKVKEVVKVYWVSPDIVSVNTEVFTSGIPKGDSFTIRIRAEFRQVDPWTVQLEYRSYVHFRESTILAGKIEKNSTEQQKITTDYFILPAFKQGWKDLVAEIKSRNQSETTSVTRSAQKQRALHRVRSIKIEDEEIEEEDEGEGGDEDEEEGDDGDDQDDNAKSIERNKKGRRESAKKQKELKEKELTQMNWQLKQIIAAFLVVYVATIAYYSLFSSAK